MIYSVRGKLIHKEVNFAVVETAGVGYACRITCTTASQIGEVGEEVFLYTYLNVKEDNVELFGFYSRQELNCFKLLTSVSGIGKAKAIDILSDLDPQRFALAVASEDCKLLAKTKGIGIKAAQRIVLELKDKVEKENISAEAFRTTVSSSASVTDSSSEAVTALITLGFNQSEVMNVMGKIDTSQPTEKIIKQALKILGMK